MIAFPSLPQNTPNTRSSHKRRIQLRDMLERHGVDALGLARITPSSTQVGEAEVRRGARGVELEGVGITSDGTVFLMSRLELTSLPQKLGYGRRHSGSVRANDREPDKSEEDCVTSQRPTLPPRHLWIIRGGGFSSS
jgi:hypothetical protein